VISVLRLESWDVTGKKLFLAGKTEILPVFSRIKSGRFQEILKSFYPAYISIGLKFNGLCHSYLS
jgi:hypothetical protein